MTFQKPKPGSMSWGLPRSSEMKRRKPIKARSSKTEQRDDARRELVVQWLDESEAMSLLGIPECEMQFTRYCTGRAVTAHEPLLRSRGGDCTDREQVLLTCNECHTGAHGVHRAVGEELQRAYALGLLVHAWE